VKRIIMPVMKNFYRFTPQAGLFAVLTFVFSSALAQTSPTISYQGLLENNGSPANGSQTMKILIYQYATGGNPLYTETQSVDVSNGLFNVLIGSVTPLLPALDFKKQYYLAVSVNGGPESSPRSLVSFAPYAFRALNADTASYASRANFANGVSGGAVTSMNGTWGALTLSGNNGITVMNSPPNITIGSTGVQSVNSAGGKLTIVGAGGTTVADTGSVLTIRSATFTGGTGIQAVQNTDNAISIANGSGPITTLGLARQSADTGQVLTWSGSGWKPTSPSFTGIQNTDSTITITNPNGPRANIKLAKQNATLGQVLVWNDTAWRPTTVSGVAPDSLKDLGDVRVFGGNVFLGKGSGIHGVLDTATLNTAVGAYAMQLNTIGKSNTAIGNSALGQNTTGRYNSATGSAALFYNTTASNNVADGYQALYFNTTGSSNTAIGSNVMSGSGENGSGNTAIGAYALNGAVTGSSNVAVGIFAQKNNSYRSNIVAVGDSALYWNGYPLWGTPTQDSSTENTGIGSKALYTNRPGAYNTATGYQALYSNYSGYNNTANGVSALWNNGGSNNTAVGSQSLIANTSGSDNTATGYESLMANTLGGSNTAFGYLALSQNTTGSNNAAFGDNSGPTTSGLGNTTCVGSGAQATASNSVVLGNINVTSLYCQGAYFATTAASANMVVGSNGQIMRSTSSARYKTNIHDLDINTDRLYDLRPVSYTSKIDGKEYFGLVAEDVAKVLPDLAEYARSKDVIPGSTSDAMIPDAVKYPMLSVLLLDELKKEHARAESQEERLESQVAINADLERRLEALEALQKH
jgi:hypothetical protein